MRGAFCQLSLWLLQRVLPESAAADAERWAAHHYQAQPQDREVNTAETTSFKRAFLGGLALYVVGFAVGDDLLSLLFTSGGQVPFSKISGEAESVFFCVNILIKGILLLFYSRWALRHDLFHGKFVFSKRAAVICVISLILFLILSLSFQVKTNLVDSWNYFNRLHGFPFGLINTILQYVYYIFEGLVMIWIADAFQTAGDIGLRQPKIPWGGLALGMLWGLGHVFGKGWFTALTWALPFGIAVGVVYLLDKKNVEAPFLFWMIFNVV